MLYWSGIMVLSARSGILRARRNMKKLLGAVFILCLMLCLALPGALCETEEAPSEPVQTESASEKQEEAEIPKEESGGASDAEKPQDEPEEKAEKKAKLSIRLEADCLYAVADSSKVKIKAAVSGGNAPYKVKFKAKGAGSGKKTVTLDADGSCSFKCVPDEGGNLTVTVKVTDAEGNTGSKKIEVPVSVRVKEKASEWEKEIENVKLTGDWGIDLVAIARTQLGYRESKRNFIIDSTGTRRGYTRYGDWFGADYNDWCGIFVAFCMNYADIPEADYPRNNISEKWKKSLQKIDAFELPGEYEPRSGDLIFFNTDDDSSVDHMGIVESVYGGKVQAIEGNSGAGVASKKYALEDESIAGYGNTEYLMERAGRDPEAIRKTIRKEADSAKTGRTAGTMVNMRKTPGGDWVASIPEKGTEVTITGAEFCGAEIWYCVKYGDAAGYIRSDLLDTGK